MSTVSSATEVSPALLGATATGKAAIGTAQDRFLKLLVAQLQNQDPLNPADNAQMTSQMAQISTVSGIENLNATLQTMATSFNSNQSLQAAAMIGHVVSAPGNAIKLVDGKAAAGMELAGPADNVTVTVRDAAGLIVHKVNLGAQEAGILNFAWDGVTDGGQKAAAGEYRFSVEATAEGKKVDATTLSFGAVVSVTNSKDGMKLDVDGMGLVAMNDVRQVL